MEASENSYAREPPQFLKKKLREGLLQMKIFHVGALQFRESLRELLRELWSSYCPSREMPFRESNFAFRESVSEFRELLREYPGTLRQLREWPFHSESVSPEIGVVPRLLKYAFTFSAPGRLGRSFREEKRSGNLDAQITSDFSIPTRWRYEITAI